MFSIFELCVTYNEFPFIWFPTNSSTLRYDDLAISVIEFKSRDIELEIFLPKNQHTQRKLLNFENWCSGQLSKIGHHFSNKVI